jgi:hypothetical protein
MTTMDVTWLTKSGGRIDQRTVLRRENTGGSICALCMSQVMPMTITFNIQYKLLYGTVKQNVILNLCKKYQT